MYLNCAQFIPNWLFFLSKIMTIQGVKAFLKCVEHCFAGGLFLFLKM
ncbi:hypothetical protein PALI_a0301 [Pseudoalteromonas aliena SW19]|uniref:Uncharacterized protein n=1 Tax=Pseudoalteromonas aliena SW19 TaxID=1314866 RepID=A0ABR9DZM8_9GAMM|nr:hypothetical protein [Pseudoalteromonas aliena SW19]